MIRAGIIGLGKMGQIRKSVLERHPQYSLEALSDPNLPDVFQDSECAIYHNYLDVVELDIDAVFVCTPNNKTAEIVVAALDSGKHVFAEKPPGRHMQDMEIILDAESRNPRQVLKFGFNHRYHESVRQAHALVQSKRLGEIMWLRGIYGKAGGVNFHQEWRNKQEIAGGGILLDQGIHMLDLFRLFCGEFQEVKSFVTNSYWKVDVEDNAFALLRNMQGQIAFIHSSSTQWKHTFRLEIFLTEGYITVDGLVTSTRSYGRESLVIGRRQFEDEAFALGNPREEIIYFDDDLSWEKEADEFADAIIHKSPVQIGSSLDAHRTMDLVFKIYKADPSWISKWS